MARKHSKITEMDFFVSLAKNNDFFKRVLVDYDLKKEDVEKFLYDNSWRIFRTVATSEIAKKLGDKKRKTAKS